MKRWIKALGALAVLATNTKCGPVVIGGAEPDPSSGSGGGSAGSGSGTGGSESGGGGTTAIAILAKDLPSQPGGPGGGPPGISGFVGGADPDALVLLFSNEPQACASPEIGASCSADLVWQSALVLPPDLVRVGLVDLANPRIASYSFSYIGGGGACSGGGGGGGGPGAPGTLEIVASSSGSLTVNLLTPLLASSGGTFNGVQQPAVTLSGSQTLTRCEAAPAPPPPNAAVAIRGADLPAGLPASPTIGASPDPTAVYVFLGTGTQTCAAPLAPIGCAGAGRIALRIPAALQQPGTLDLSDPELAASFEIAADAGTSNCTSSTGSTFAQGTLTIASMDATSISFTLYQSLASGGSGPDFDADGLYQATICP